MPLKYNVFENIIENGAFAPLSHGFCTSSHILGKPGVTHSVPTAFINECSGYGMGHAWVTEDDHLTERNIFHNSKLNSMLSIS